MKMEIAKNLEVHYYLANESHSMDAFVRNKCEAELLAIFGELCTTLGVDVPIEALAHQEGGLRDYWKLLGENSIQITSAALIFSTLLSIANTVSTRIPVSDPEKDEREKQIQELTIEEKRLAIEERKLALEKLKKEAQQGIPSKGTIEGAAKAVEQNPKIQIRRSNFYRVLSIHEKVIGIGFSAIAQDGKAIEQENFVPRADFKKYVLNTNELPVETIDGAIIEIVAPVLKEGNYKWRGIYEGKSISFSMTDAEFKTSVLREEVSFQHGSGINCVLRIFRKFDELGEVVITGYSVGTVIEKKDGASTYETPQGKKHRTYKKFIKNQAGLF
jgi:hypothetical protein